MSENTSNNAGHGDTSLNNGRVFKRRIRTFEHPEERRPAGAKNSANSSEFDIPNGLLAFQERSHFAHFSAQRTPGPEPDPAVLPRIPESQAEMGERIQALRTIYRAEHEQKYGPVQAKTLSVSQPDDPQEKEAERMADRVLRMEALPEEDEVQRAEMPEEEELQREAMPEEDELHRDTMPEDEEMQREVMPEEEELQREKKPEEEEIARAPAPTPRPVQATTPETALYRALAELSKTPELSATPPSDSGYVARMPGWNGTRRVQGKVIATRQQSLIHLPVGADGIQRALMRDARGIKIIERHPPGRDGVALQKVYRMSVAEAARAGALGQTEEPGIQHEADGELRTSTDTATRIESKRGSGETLGTHEREFFESRMDADFSGVRIHRDAEAASLAKDVNAKAFTIGGDVFFGEGQYQPGSSAGKKLIAHELTHTVQQGAAERVAREADGESNRGGAPGKEDPHAIIKKHTKFLGQNLDEAGLGNELLQLAIKNQFSTVYAVFQALGDPDRDDVALEMMQAASDRTLIQFAASPSGTALLDYLYDQLTAGSLDASEQQQADRILKIRAQPTANQFPVKPDGIKVFPLRQVGLTVLEPTPIMARRAGRGRIHVKYPVRSFMAILGTPEQKTLPENVFTTGIELPATEIIGVKLNDEGGTVVYRPALFLVEISNKGETQVMQTMAEAAGIGLTLGSGALLSLGVEASMLARVALWADRVAFLFGTLGTVIREHRGWFINRFGDAGANFVRYSELMQSAAFLYGGARLVLGLGGLTLNFASAVRQWRQAVHKARSELSAEEQARVKLVESEVREIMEKARAIRKARKGREKEHDPLFDEDVPVTEAPLHTPADKSLKKLMDRILNERRRAIKLGKTWKLSEAEVAELITTYRTPQVHAEMPSNVVLNELSFQTNVEWAAIRLKSGPVLLKTDGKRGEVGLSIRQDIVEVIHTHPEGSSLEASEQDYLAYKRLVSVEKADVRLFRIIMGGKHRDYTLAQLKKTFEP